MGVGWGEAPPAPNVLQATTSRPPGPEGAGEGDFDHPKEADFSVNPSGHVAWMVVQVILTPEVAEVEDLDATIRGKGGFGSTGV
uniref:dUTP diphosphatase n=1 Tax=Aegilops tauschii TaxID=37682 RepID=M8BI99_AEGTA